MSSAVEPTEDLPAASRRRRWRIGNDKGAVIPLTALGIVVLMAFVGFAVDVGLAFNERRQEQAAVDVATLSIARMAFDDAALTPDDYFEEAMRLSLTNMDGNVTPEEWEQRFRTCADTGRVAAGYPVPLPLSDGSSIDCISLTADLSAIRVRLPDTAVPTVFASLVGFNSWTISAFAEAGLVVQPAPNIIPFALSAAPDAAGRYCLREPQGNNNSATPAGIDCAGMNQGNTGVIDIVRPSFSTSNQNCNGGHATIIERNIAMGVDHFLSTYPGTGATVRETCPNVISGLEPNEIFTDTGQNSMGAVEPGLITRNAGYYEDGGPARLKRGPYPKTMDIKGHMVDDEPLWAFIDTTLNFGVDAPVSCDPASITNPANWVDPRAGLDACFADFYNGTEADLYDGPLFTDELMESPRFTWVPEAWEDLSTLSGSSWFTIKQFRPVFIQSIYYNTGNCWWGLDPGQPNKMYNTGTCWQPSHTVVNNAGLRGLGAYYFQMEMLPTEILDRGVTAGGESSQIALIR